MKQIIEGILFIVIGVIVLYWTIKYPSKKKNVLLPNLSGMLAGIFLIIIGFLVLIGHLPPL